MNDINVAELVWAKKNFRLIVMIATDNEVFWIELNWIEYYLSWNLNRIPRGRAWKYEGLLF